MLHQTQRKWEKKEKWKERNRNKVKKMKPERDNGREWPQAAPWSDFLISLFLILFMLSLSNYLFLASVSLPYSYFSHFHFSLFLNSLRLMKHRVTVWKFTLFAIFCCLYSSNTFTIHFVVYKLFLCNTI